MDMYSRNELAVLALLFTLLVLPPLFFLLFLLFLGSSCSLLFYPDAFDEGLDGLAVGVLFGGTALNSHLVDLLCDVEVANELVDRVLDVAEHGEGRLVVDA